MASYPIVDLTEPGAAPEQTESGMVASRGVLGRLDPAELAGKITALRDEMASVLTPAVPVKSWGLQSVELSLAITAEGGIAFIAKGSVEASIALTFGPS